MNERVVGTVKWFNKAKGYGFITHENNSNDIFVHFSAIQMEGYRYLEEGDRVEFALEETAKGLQASKVTRLNPTNLSL
ncbi:MAG: cold shock domain-containing protein [Anaerolineae bacterium]|nr:cold shock domain-containing protein [Anaerolineae bacterium]